MLSNILNRRYFMAICLAGILVTPLPRRAEALNEGDAVQLVNNVVADIDRIIASEKSEKATIREFEEIFVQYADVPIMARYALGIEARSASPAQLRKFTKAFQGYMSRKYGRRFQEFIGGEVVVQNARKIKAGYEVRTSVKLRGSSPFDVTFLVSDKSGRDKFFNMFIEGVNLLLTERTEIGAMLDAHKGNLNEVIGKLNQVG